MVVMLPKIIDNKRRKLAEVLNSIAVEHNSVSIATGYWDLKGLQLIFENIKNYESVRILLGQEPIAPRYAKRLNIDKPEESFPEDDFKDDIQEVLQKNEMRDLVFTFKELIKKGKVEVRVYRRSFLHAKAYIFGDYKSSNAVGIIGSSNFTEAGLTTNTELNSPEDNYQVVTFKPHSEEQEFGHLSWFDSLWFDEFTEDWNGTFVSLLEDSPVGDMTFGPYDSYIRTLMEVFPDELIPKPELEQDTKDILYSFQNRNAGILINKLDKLGTAILADSVGLGKTITAGAVIQHYIRSGAKRIVILPPASLKKQWEDDLREHFELMKDNDFKVISQQDLSAMEDEALNDRLRSVDLFVIDEAHNLRNPNSIRHKYILNWFNKNKPSKVLMLTATPINNSLGDLAELIGLGLKGELKSIQVPYLDRKNDRIKVIDFNEALKLIQSKRDKDPDFDWNHYRPTLVKGIQHFLVRSTRQGVEKEGSLRDISGSTKAFPESVVKQINYTFSPEITDKIYNLIGERLTVFEKVDPRRLNLEKIAEATQQTSHPLDFAQDLQEGVEKNLITNIFQIINLLGFVPYRPEIYQHRIYNKRIEDIKSLELKGEEKRRISSQLAIHNMLLTTWLKRLESSTQSLSLSLDNYKNRLDSFERWLDRGYILSFKEMNIVEQEYGDDIVKAFDDYDNFSPSLDSSDEELKQKGVKKREVNSDVYNLEALRFDLNREHKIISVLHLLLSEVNDCYSDGKLVAFAQQMDKIILEQNYGEKVLVFSFFADTVNYLKENLPKLSTIDNFLKRAEFISGQTRNVLDVTRRFSPVSKNYVMKNTDKPVDFLFATDVLSEGQNLQDAGVLINYDLHWNPVRMIQRNGRVNRLGSNFEEVLIANMRPEENLEFYLSLVDRLEKKIETIKNSVGLDQGILNNDDINPIEYIEDLKKLYSNDSNEASETLDKLDDDNDLLSWTNDHVYKLREYLNVSTSSEIERLKNIPNKKWNYLPVTTALERDYALSLVRIDGSISITGENISQVFFIRTDPFDNYKTLPLDEFKALGYLKANPEDNERKRDCIEVDRDKVTRRVEAQAKHRAEVKRKNIVWTPSLERAIKIMQNNYPEIPLQPLIQNNIQTSYDKREFESLVRKINEEIKELGAVTPRTSSKFKIFVDELSKQKNKDFISKVETNVLNYAHLK